MSSIANDDTLIAIPDDEGGRSKISGLKGDAADLFINATNSGYNDTTIAAVQCKEDDTDIGHLSRIIN